MKLPRTSARKVVATLKRDSWYEHHQRGAHLAMRHPQKRGQVTVPKHATKDIHPSTLKSILVQAGITDEEFIKLLRRR